jgi:hypothetical protein
MRTSPRALAACCAPSAADVVRWLLIAILAWTATAAHADELPAAADGEWIEVRSANFVFTSQLSTRATRDLVEHAEALRAAMEQLTAYDVTLSRPVLVTVFRDREALDPYLHVVNGRPASAAGTYRRRLEADFITLASGSYDVRSVLAHEYAHLFLERTHPGLPLWLEEGLAEFFGTFTVRRGTARLGGAIEGRLRQLRSRAWLPLSDVVDITHDHPLYNEANRKTMVYAQVWAVTYHLLIGSTERAGQLQTFIHLMDGGAEHDQAFLEAFGTDPDGLEEEVRATMEHPIFRSVGAKFSAPDRGDLPTRSIEPADHLTRLGELLVNDYTRPPTLAELHFLRALTIDEAWARAVSGLGEVARRLDRTEDALEYQRYAAELDPYDPIIAYRLGTGLGRNRLGSHEAVTALRTATRLDPSFAPAWVELTRQLLAADAPEQALAAASRAARLEPLNSGVVHLLIRALLGAGRRADAMALIDAKALRTSDDRARAWAHIAEADLKAIRSAIEDDRLEEADDMITRVASEVLPRVEDENVSVQLDVLRTQATDRRFAQRLAAAGDARLAGDHQTAEALAQEIAEDPSAGLWAARARQFLAGARAPSRDPVPVATVSEAELDTLNRLLAARDYRAALRLLEDLDQRVSHDRDDWIDAKIREIERTLARNAFVDTYNRAVDLYNAGSIEAACRVMRDVDPSKLESLDRQDVVDFLTDCP